MVIFPILDLWAAYRIEKFRLYFLIVWVIMAVIWTVTDYAIYGELFSDDSPTTLFILEYAVDIIIAMILIRKWTIEWNKKAESEKSTE